MKTLYDIMLAQQLRRNNFLIAVSTGDLNKTNLDHYHAHVRRLERIEEKQTHRYIKHLENAMR